jgi:hypothetical protein
VKIKMPGGDRTGPYGDGPMTGRGLGYCADYSFPGYMVPAPRFGRGRGMGRGQGRGRGTMYNPRGLLRPRFWRIFGMSQPTPNIPKEKELGILKEQKKNLERVIDQLEKGEG